MYPDPDLLIRGIDPDPHQNVMDPEHWFLQQNQILNKSYSVADQDLGSGIIFFRIPDPEIRADGNIQFFPLFYSRGTGKLSGSVSRLFTPLYV